MIQETIHAPGVPQGPAGSYSACKKVGVPAGLHLVTWLPPGLDEATVVDAAARAGVLADVRTAPGSRRLPQFGRASLASELAPRGVAYAHLPELGGFRRPIGVDARAFDAPFSVRTDANAKLPSAAVVVW